MAEEPPIVPEEPDDSTAIPDGGKNRTKTIVWSAVILAALAVVLFLVTRDESNLHVEKLSDLKSHELRVESAHLVVRPAGRFIMVRLKPTENWILAHLRPGQKVYVFDESGNLRETIEND